MKTTIPISASATTRTRSGLTTIAAMTTTAPPTTPSFHTSTSKATQINSIFLSSSRSPSSYTRINTEMKSKATAAQSSQAYFLDTSTSAYFENSKLLHTKFMTVQPTTEDEQELTETTGK